MDWESCLMHIPYSGYIKISWPINFIQVERILLRPQTSFFSTWDVTFSKTVKNWHIKSRREINPNVCVSCMCWVLVCHLLQKNIPSIIHKIHRKSTCLFHVATTKYIGLASWITKFHFNCLNLLFNFTCFSGISCFWHTSEVV